MLYFNFLVDKNLRGISIIVEFRKIILKSVIRNFLLVFRVLGGDSEGTEKQYDTDNEGGIEIIFLNE